MESAEQGLVKGETVKFIKDYDLYGLELIGLNGMFYKETPSGKYLIYIKQNKEWCEVEPDFIRRVRPGFVNKENSSLCSKIKTMVYSFE